MGRKPRLHVPGGLYHVILRGNDRKPIFFSDGDHARWENILAEGLSRYEHRVHAWCWMTNHVHIALQAGHRPIAALMQYAASRYARQTNKILGRTGHLFERRYRAILVDSDAYLLALVRYIHLNPLRAGIAANLPQYPWSSHLSYMGLTDCDFLTTDWVLSMFSPQRRTALSGYCQYMDGDPVMDTNTPFSRGMDKDDRILGDNHFLERVSRENATAIIQRELNDIVTAYCKAYGVTEADLRAPSRRRKHAQIRALIADQARKEGAATLAEVARRFNRSNAALSQAVKNLRPK